MTMRSTKKVLTLANHGRAPGQTRHFWPDIVGFKYKISNIQAGIGRTQIERIKELIAGKRRVFRYYAECLADQQVKMNPEPAGTVNGFWMPTIVVDERVPFDRDALLVAFTENTIDARTFFWPLSILPMFTRQPENTVS
jgi:perosamine synthetase